MIRKVNKKYVLYSKDGEKILGTFVSKEKAEERERQIVKAKYAKEK